MKIVLALLLLAAPAFAESPAEVEAKQHFMTGQKHFDAARWADALSEFSQSYQLSKYPALVYKMALCQDQLGKLAEAQALYEKYLAEDPQTPRRPGIKERIGKIKEQLAIRPAVVVVPVVEPPRRTPVYKKWWLWTIVGVVVAGGAVGVAVGVTQTGIKRDYEWNPDFFIGPQAVVAF